MTTVTGGTLSVEFDDTVYTDINMQVYLFDADGTPYKFCGYSVHNASGVQGDWVFDNWKDPGASGVSYGKCAKSFTTVIPDGKYCMVTFNLGSNAKAVWAMDGGMVMTVIGGVANV